MANGLIMQTVGPSALAIGGALLMVAAAAHLACILIGARAYRFMGAGERMARAAEAGHLEPTVVTLIITVVLGLCALYAWSGAGLLAPMPFTKWVLSAVSLVLLARALAYPLLRPAFPENSTRFWRVSSGICLALGLLLAAGCVWLWLA